MTTAPTKHRKKIEIATAIEVGGEEESDVRDDVEDPEGDEVGAGV